MDWLAGATRWIIKSYREGLEMSCTVQCRQRLEARHEHVRAALRRRKKPTLH